MVLLSPIIALLLAFAAEILIVYDAGALAFVLFGAGVGGLLLFRALPGARRGVSET